MKWQKLAVIVLAFALIASNAFWAYVTIDNGVTNTYYETEFQYHREALRQLIAVVPIAGRQDSTKQQILEAAKNAVNDHEVFEKDGYIWVGRIGLKFSPSGRLMKITPSWDLGADWHESNAHGST